MENKEYAKTKRKQRERKVMKVTALMNSNGRDGSLPSPITSGGAINGIVYNARTVNL